MHVCDAITGGRACLNMKAHLCFMLTSYTKSEGIFYAWPLTVKPGVGSSPWFPCGTSKKVSIFGAV